MLMTWTVPVGDAGLEVKPVLMFLVVTLVVAGAWVAVVLGAMRRSRAWPRVTATVVADTSLRWGRIRISYGGQRIPIAFDLPDRIPVASHLKLAGEEDPPKPGTLIEIVYDPAEPRKVEYYTSTREDIIVICMMVMFVLVTAGIVWVGFHH